MAQTLTRILVHVVFSTKNRRNLITPQIEDEMYAYLGAICRNRDSPALAIGGTENHVHLLIKPLEEHRDQPSDDDAQKGFLGVDQNEGRWIFEFSLAGGIRRVIA